MNLEHQNWRDVFWDEAWVGRAPIPAKDSGSHFKMYSVLGVSIESAVAQGPVLSQMQTLYQHISSFM